MTDPKLFQLTEEDKAHYMDLIEKIDTVHSRAITRVLGRKISGMLDEGRLNSVEVALIDDIAKLMGILELYPELPQPVVKKILFAMTYFVDENDEIPDMIPDYGYLDDVKVVEWVIDDIQDQIPPMTKS
ncbi:MAG TPA: DUF1232 domain-containing protein [Candidatus Marinimicrobia bacterium]|jgi:hypothetical protein|nr:DUF1232 domain-containing protein [Candidatus Neomarinimicrobiota bacterium]HIC37036.1 DUF1232 domain-containing protein [Candidatus Neomarinimicrobiota bacterium]HIN02391.1 DUF1232 domain-containing protein [Candidatus Neomarinimicrobiota bacterium]